MGHGPSPPLRQVLRIIAARRGSAPPRLSRLSPNRFSSLCLGLRAPSSPTLPKNELVAEADEREEVQPQNIHVMWGKMSSSMFRKVNKTRERPGICARPYTYCCESHL